MLEENKVRRQQVREEGGGEEANESGRINGMRYELKSKKMATVSMGRRRRRRRRRMRCTFKSSRHFWTLTTISLPSALSSSSFHGGNKKPAMQTNQTTNKKRKMDTFANYVHSQESSESTTTTTTTTTTKRATDSIVRVRNISDGKLLIVYDQTNDEQKVMKRPNKVEKKKLEQMKCEPTTTTRNGPEGSNWLWWPSLGLAKRTKSPSNCSSIEPKMPSIKSLPLITCLLCLTVSLAVTAMSSTTPAEPTRTMPVPRRASSAAAPDPLTIAPPFAPTRRPRQEVDRRQQEQQQHPGEADRNNLLLVDRRQQLMGADSSSKFTRTNELDVFLDDMNHNELRTLASGRPIHDLFQAKPVAPMTPVGARASGGQPATTAAGSDNRTSREASPSTGGLVGSHSEQQIYSECALILQRTYVKNIDDPKHQMVPFGKTEQACIGYKHIDKAIEQAKHKLKFREFAKMRKKPLQQPPGGDGTRRPPLAPLEIIHSTLEPPEDLIAAIGEINMATTQIIADQFDLSNDELLNGLPLIDMSKTKFWSICPLLVRQDIKCELSRFRTYTGHCNNLKHPSWGAAMTPYARYLPPVHPDGIWIPRKSIVSEITFHLGEGHRETHSSIAPTMPVPAFNEPHLHPKMHHNHLRAESNDDGGGDEDMASSVHFVRRAKLDEMNGVGPRPYDAAASMAVMSNSMSGPAAATLFGDSAAHTNHHHHHHLTSASSPAIIHKTSRSMPQELPSARLVSSIVHRDADQPNHDLTVLFMSWGQVINHDMTRAAQPPSSIKCCPQAGGQQQEPKHKLCMPIQVPQNDPFYSKFNVQCLEFRRSLAGVRPNCVLGPRVHQNAITHSVDASYVYGSSQAQADALRLFKGGRLRDRDWFHREGLKPLLPGQEIEPDLECIARPKDLFCFLAGDVRANEQTHLTVLHTIYMREHNRLADKLAELNPHWDDERTYQEARHIVAAGVQHAMINEYIPLLIGRKMSDLYNLTASQGSSHHPHHSHHHHQSGRHAFWRGYDPTVTTSVSNSFAAAAFRQGHTFVQGTIERYNKYHEFVAAEKLRHLFKQPFLLYQPGVIDELVLGMLNQPSQSHDPFMSEDVSGHLFQPPELQFGHDLAAINIQRGRDQGLPGYNLWREWCGLPRAETFDQLEPYLTNHTAYHYSRLFKHVDDIDLWSGGVSERRLPGAAIGPTFACIIARQFSNTRRGDRFWYENPGLPSSFTPDQLAEIRKVTLAKLLCSNSDDLPTIQRWALRMAHPVLNPRVDCHQLPEMDLQYWQEE